MTESLATFFETMRPYLSGRTTLEQTRARLGSSPSGDDDFAFYRVLVERNVFQILAEQHGPTRTVMQRLQPGLWASVVRQYVDAHPPTHWHPSYVGAGLSEFLAECREAGDQRIDPLFEEVADFCWVRMLAQRCPDGVGDGFEQRLFIRQYTRPIAPLVAAITEDPNAPIPPPQPVVVFIYRHWRDLDVRVFSPSAAGLVALARRQGATVPEALQAVPPEDVEAADTLLVEHGVLVPADASSPG